MNRMAFPANSLCAVGMVVSSSGSRTAVSLNAAYVHGTSGPAVAIRFIAQSADAINELYIFLDGNGGTLANVTMECKIYNENTVSRAGTTVRATSTATAMPASTGKWIKFTFGTPYTPTVGEILWFVAYNTSASPTVDYPQILTGTNAIGQTSAIGIDMPYSTTNGFSGNGTAQPKAPHVIKAGSAYVGQPFTQLSNSYNTNNTRERGIVVAPTEDITVGGVIFNVGTTAPANLVIYDNATAPGGTALKTVHLDSDTNATTGDVCCGMCFAPYTFTGGLTYKVTLTFGSSSQLPSVWQIEDYASYSSMFDAMRALDTLNACYGCIDDGAGGWTIDKAICPALALYIVDNPEQSAAGGGHIIGG